VTDLGARGRSGRPERFRAAALERAWVQPAQMPKANYNERVSLNIAHAPGTIRE